MKSVKAIAVWAAFLALLIPLPTFAADLLRCQAKDAISLQKDGTLRKDSGAELASNDNYIVDISTGVVRVSNPSPSMMSIRLSPAQWFVAQEGNDLNDTVLVPRNPTMSSVSTFARDDLRDAATDFIRIRQWKGQSTILFIRYALSTMVSGTCEPIQ